MEDGEKLKQAAAIAFSVAVTALILFANPVGLLKDEVGDLGYAGVFLIMLVTSATVVLPAPGLLSVFAAGASYNPVLVGIAGGLGSALGELTGYMFGFGAEAVLPDKNDTYRRITEWMKANGFATLFVLSLIPNPLFDIAGIAAGSLRYPWWKFLIACAAGKILKSIAFAYLGMYGVSFFQ